jgi:hypothetical protein
MKYTTARIAASRVKVGTVLYHGGRVVSVSREANGTVIITTKHGAMVYAPSTRLTYYPYL